MIKHSAAKIFLGLFFIITLSACDSGFKRSGVKDGMPNSFSALDKEKDLSDNEFDQENIDGVIKSDDQDDGSLLTTPYTVPPGTPALSAPGYPQAGFPVYGGGGGGGGGSRGRGSINKKFFCKNELDECDTGLLGVCAEGQIMCKHEKEICEPIITPGEQAEICANGLDDDCNGIVDRDCCLSLVPENSTKLYVAPNGNNIGNNCQNENAPCLTIAHAISEATGGEAIVVKPGDYSESELIVDKSLYIVGESGSDFTTIRAAGAHRVITVSNEIAELDVTLCGLTITDGNGRSAVNDNNGGGLLNNGEMLTINISVIMNNRANSNGGGVANFDGGTIDITDTTINGNHSNEDGGGIYNTSDGSIITITTSTISNNHTNNYGGGIYNAATIEIIDSTISDNEASGNAGGIANIGESALADITNSTISDNTADFTGGGIHNTNDGSTTITDTTISDNIANDGSGGGVFNESSGSITINSSTISGNYANNDGGGVANTFNASTTITNSTVSGNEAGINGGGVYNDFNATTATTINNSTIAQNSATASGDGIYIGSGTVNVYHAIVWDDVSGNDDCFVAGGTLSDNGFNIESGTSCGFLNNGQQNVDAAELDLGPLEDNGGPTETHALEGDSVAIDTGDAGCGVDVDQRGEPRPIDYTNNPPPKCDIGAFERQLNE